VVELCAMVSQERILVEAGVTGRTEQRVFMVDVRG
jgi:hypothetical protein